MYLCRASCSQAYTTYAPRCALSSADLAQYAARCGQTPCHKGNLYFHFHSHFAFFPTSFYRTLFTPRLLSSGPYIVAGAKLAKCRRENEEAEAEAEEK